MDPKWARVWFAATAAAVATGVGLGMVLGWRNPTFRLAEGGELPRFGGSAAGRALNTLAFFTIRSNLVVGGTCLLLALQPVRSSTLFRTLRLIGLVAITVTFVVFHVALTNLLDLDTLARLQDKLVHVVVPIMAVVGWLAFGPRGQTSARIARLTLAFPAAYMIFTVIRGPLASDWYPYPFADVKVLGYVRVTINAVWIGLLFIGVAAAATALDARLPTRRPAPVESVAGAAER